MQEKFNTDLILFDLDGTLIDTAPDFVTTLNHMLVRDGKKKLDLSSIRPFVSDGSSKMIKLGYGINQNDRNFENLQKDFLELYKENFLNKCNLFEGVNNILNFLNKNNIKFGIVTNKPKRFANIANALHAKIPLSGDAQRTSVKNRSKKKGKNTI